MMLKCSRRIDRFSKAPLERTLYVVLKHVAGRATHDAEVLACKAFGADFWTHLVIQVIESPINCDDTYHHTVDAGLCH